MSDENKTSTTFLKEVYNTVMESLESDVDVEIAEDTANEYKERLKEKKLEIMSYEARVRRVKVEIADLKRNFINERSLC